MGFAPAAKSPHPLRVRIIIEPSPRLETTMSDLSRHVARWTAPLFLGAALLALSTWASEPKGQFYGAKPTEYPAWFKESFLNLKDDVAEATAAKKRVVVIFHQDNCPYCNLLVERNLAQKDIEDLMRSRFDPIAINMWGDREVTNLDGNRMTEKDLAASLKVQFTPTILFFDEAGKTILRLNGYIPPQRFKLTLEYVAQHQEKNIAYRDYMAKHEPAPGKGELFAEDFFKPAPHDLTKKTQPIAVFFEQKDCPACETLHTKVLIDKETREVIGKVHNIQLDMWSNTPVVTPDGKRLSAREWAKKLDVKYAPTIVLLDPQGKEIIRSEAFFKVFHTQGIFAYVESSAYKTEPNFQRYLSARAEHFREQGRDVDIWRLSDEPPGTR
jgi:thioredoxin-related protein